MFKTHIKKTNYIKIMSLACFVILLGFSGITLAKYMSVQHSKGVATATGMYFTSNFLKRVDNVEDKSAFQTFYNRTAWDGTSNLDVPIEIQNYENRLLYNDETIKIKYDLSFQLAEKPSENGKYVISYGEDEAIIELKWNDSLKGTSVPEGVFVQPGNNGQGDTITIEGLELNGGSAAKNTVKIQISPLSEDTTKKHQTEPIHVWAQVKEPSYIADSGYNLGGTLVATTSDTAFSLQSSFEIEKRLSTENFKELLNRESGFHYEIKATGGSELQTYKIKITWDKQLKLNAYDKWYEKAVEKGENHMVIEIEPFSTVPLIFYKTDQFNVDYIKDIQNFRDLVTVEEKE